MIDATNYTFEQLKRELVSFKKNDPLVHLGSSLSYWKSVAVENDQTIIRVSKNPEWNKIYKRCVDFYKETGTQTACFVSHVIKWKFKEDWIESPLVLHPISSSIDKLKDEFVFEKLDSAFINPFIEKQFAEQFNLALTLDNFQSVLVENFTIDEVTLIGQFHYHRVLHLKELEAIEKMPWNGLLNHLLGEGTNTEFDFNFSDQNLVDVDPSQREVLSHFGKESFVLQGPPGTGKSQVLINCIGKLLYSSKTSLIVSEKKPALDVLRKKLSELNLEAYSLLIDDQTDQRYIYTHLLKTWNQLEQSTESYNSNFSIAKLQKDRLQLLLDRINSKELSSGISYWELIEWKQKLVTNVEPNTYYSVSLKTWEETKNSIHKIKEIPFDLWRVVPQKFWNQSAIESWKLWRKNWEQFSTIFRFNTISDFRIWNQIAIVYQLQKEVGFVNQLELIQSKTKWKSFQKWKKAFFATQLEIDALKEKQRLWKHVPSVGEIDAVIADSNRFLKKRKAVRKVENWGISFVDLPMVSENVLKSEELKTQFVKIQQELAALGLFDPKRDFISIDLLQTQLNGIHQEAFAKVKNLTVEQLSVFEKHLSEFLNFTQINWIETNVSNQLIAEVVRVLDEHLPLIENQLETVQKIPNSIYYWMQRKSSWSEVEQQIIANEWKSFEIIFPELAQFSVENARQLLMEIQQQIEQEQAGFIKEIHAKRKQAFDDLHQLILASPSKLTPEEKERRSRLKKGKAILVKELNKRRQHLPIRWLFESDAKEWLTCLIPVWIMTPSQVAKTIPLVADFVDVSLVDEASQLPISHTIGTLYRSKQIVIAGDSQQMAPSSFFQSEMKHSVLSWSSFYFKNYHLKYHYRSEHPALIEFSNRYFYQNSLKVFPAFKRESEPIVWIKNPAGKYMDGSNESEAKLLAEQIEERISNSQTLGIVAFSETQLKTIWKQLSPSTQEKLQTRMDEHTAFFKSLDKVQGDECDVLLISFGYAKDENEQFKLHLGPLLHDQGEKRLNVLFSRARQKIIFVSSVEVSDFPLSDQPSVHLLKGFMQYLTAIDDQKIQEPNLENWLHTSSSADEIVSNFAIYSKRGWQL